MPSIRRRSLPAVALAALLASCARARQSVAPPPTSMALPQAAMSMPTENLPPGPLAPGFDGGGAWINSEPLTLAGLRGQVVLVKFWTYG
jgi:hypothetical protein